MELTTQLRICLLSVVLTLVAVRAQPSMHSQHLSVNYPDNDELMLDKLEKIANAQLDAARGRRTSRQRLTTPYMTSPKCDTSSVYRAIDGTCNNLKDPWNGAAKTPLSRLGAQKYQDGVSDPRELHFYTEGKLPHARQISLSVHLTRSNLSTQHNHLLMSYGQFLDHDITLSPESGGEEAEDMKEKCCEHIHTSDMEECMPLMTENDPLFKRTCIPFLRSAPVPGLPGARFERYQMNDLTSWVDGSQIYGNTLLLSKQLRSYRNGKLKSKPEYNGSEGLPANPENPSNCPKATMPMCSFMAGDVRSSEQAGLTSMHTLFVREHNRIASALSYLNPQCDDEHIYQITRKIVGAIIQRITYAEWLPTILGPKLMDQYKLRVSNRGRFYGYSDKYDASIMSEFSTAAFRFGHSLVRQTFSNSRYSETDLEDMFDSFNTIQKTGSDSLLQGMVKDKMETCDRFITDGLRDNLFNEELDLMALNIHRGRDHGLTSYNDVRKSLGLYVHKVWNSMAGESHSFTATNSMAKMYPDPEDVELFVGGLSEEPVEGGVVGETFAHIIAEQFKRLKYADRFWHETSDKELGFSNRQLNEIRKASFALLYCENIPGVKVQKDLLLLPSRSNPVVRCGSLPSIDLTAWQENTPYGAQKPAPKLPSAPVKPYSPPSMGNVVKQHTGMVREMQRYFGLNYNIPKNHKKRVSHKKHRRRYRNRYYK